MTRPRTRAVGRWMVSFAGYPLGGYAAFLLTGRVDGHGPALAGGLLTGAVLGAVQVWALGRARPRALAWIMATALGVMAGVAAGGALVDYRTDLRSLVVEGAVTGALVGVAQAVVLVRRLGPLAYAWPVFLSGTFAAGWAVTTSAGIDVDQQFTIFGSSGALVATVLTAVLPLALDPRRTGVQSRRPPAAQRGSADGPLRDCQVDDPGEALEHGGREVGRAEDRP